MLKFSQTLTHTEAALEVSVSLWREGRFDEAREVVTTALKSSSPILNDDELRLWLRLAVIEQSAGNITKARDIYVSISPLVDATEDLLLKGKYGMNFAYTRRRLGDTDGAIEMLTWASVYYEQAGEWGLRSDVENNIGNILSDVRKFDEAHGHYAEALRGCADQYAQAQVEESIASAYLKENRPFDAFPHILKSAQLLGGSERTPLLKETVGTMRRTCEEIEKRLKAEEERPRIEAALNKHGGRITPAARELDMEPATLSWKLEHQYPESLHLRAPKKKARGRHVKK